MSSPGQLTQSPLLQTVTSEAYDTARLRVVLSDDLSIEGVHMAPPTLIYSILSRCVSVLPRVGACRNHQQVHHKQYLKVSSM